jgi:sirohydrochlorin ferrochelatase
VKEDIHLEVAIAQQDLGQELTINLRPHLGSHPGLSGLLEAQLAEIKADDSVVCIILAHGSRRAGSQEPVEAMAKQLGAVSAYWAVPPKLESRVQELVRVGYKQIVILPYFLFVGGITDAIAQSVELLKEQFPNASLQMAEPLGASAELAKLIMDLVEG